MNSTYSKFEEWCIKLEKATGVSYLIVFKNPLEQIKENWNKNSYETDVFINTVLEDLNTQNQHELIVEFVEIIFPYLQSGNNTKLLLSMLVNAGVASDKIGRSGAAAAMYQKAETIVYNANMVFDIEASRIAGSLFYNKAKLLLERDRVAAVQSLFEAIDYFKAGGYKGGIARCMNMHAYTMPKERNYERIDLYLKAADLFEEENDINSQAMAFANVGERLIENGDAAHGIQYIQKALELNKQNHNPFYLGYTYMMLAEAYCAMKDWAKAKEFTTAAEADLHKANILVYAKRLDAIKSIIEAHSTINK